MFSFLKKLFSKGQTPDGAQTRTPAAEDKPRKDRGGKSARGEARPAREGGRPGRDGAPRRDRNSDRPRQDRPQSRREGRPGEPRETRRPAAPPRTFPAPVVPASDWDPASYAIPEKEGSRRFQFSKR